MMDIFTKIEQSKSVTSKEVFIANDKFPAWKLPNILRLSNEIGDDRYKCDFGALYFKVDQYLEDLHKS